MSKRRSSRRYDGRPAFLRREVGGAPYWFIIAVVVVLLAIGVLTLAQMMQQ
jgi:hypothetical protein